MREPRWFGVAIDKSSYERLGVEEGAGFVAGPEVAEDDNAGDCGVGAPEGREGVALEEHDGEENDEICCAEDDHHSDF